jgi:hypothetical protein
MKLSQTHQLNSPFKFTFSLLNLHDYQNGSAKCRVKCPKSSSYPNQSRRFHFLLSSFKLVVIQIKDASFIPEPRHSNFPLSISGDDQHACGTLTANEPLGVTVTPQHLISRQMPDFRFISEAKSSLSFPIRGKFPRSVTVLTKFPDFSSYPSQIGRFHTENQQSLVSRWKRPRLPDS